MEEPFKETLGQFLRGQRESRRVSLDQLSRATRISIPFLKALEEDDYDFFSQKEFIPGFLKLYAKHLDLDPQEVLQRHAFQSEAQRSKKSFQQPSLFGHFNFPIEKVTKKKRLPGRKPKQGIIGASLLFLAFGLFLYFQLSPEKTREREPSPPALSPDVAPKEVVEKPGEILPAVPIEKESPPLKAQSAPESNLSAQPSTNQTETQSAENPVPPVPKRMKVIGNRDSKRYHLPGMKYYDEVLAYHRVEFDSEQEAIRAGYRKARR